MAQTTCSAARTVRPPVPKPTESLLADCTSPTIEIETVSALIDAAITRDGGFSQHSANRGGAAGCGRHHPCHAQRRAWRTGLHPGCPRSPYRRGATHPLHPSFSRSAGHHAASAPASAADGQWSSRLVAGPAEERRRLVYRRVHRRSARRAFVRSRLARIDALDPFSHLAERPERGNRRAAAPS